MADSAGDHPPPPPHRPSPIPRLGFPSHHFPPSSPSRTQRRRFGGYPLGRRIWFRPLAQVCWAARGSADTARSPARWVSGGGPVEQWRGLACRHSVVMGRKKIKIERIPDERNRSVRAVRDMRGREGRSGSLGRGDKMEHRRRSRPWASCLVAAVALRRCRIRDRLRTCYVWCVHVLACRCAKYGARTLYPFKGIRCYCSVTGVRLYGL